MTRHPAGLRRRPVLAVDTDAALGNLERELAGRSSPPEQHVVIQMVRLLSSAPLEL